MVKSNLEKLMILHCAPTLAGIKLGSMFNYYWEDNSLMYLDLESWNERLNPYDLYLELIRETNQFAIVYVYRKKALKELLKLNYVKTILKPFGYEEMETDACIQKLKERLKENPDFPHEIGVFLGYPIYDVIGFIRNHGENSIMCGLWKVYFKQWEAVRLFAQYKKCKDQYMKDYQEGREILQILRRGPESI